MTDIKIDNIGGNCPVQAEGTFDGVPFYFRARGRRWTIGVAGDTVMDPEWEYGERYGDGPYDAGWMPLDEAEAFIRASAERWAKREET